MAAARRGIEGAVPQVDLRIRGWAPLRPGDPPGLLERGSTYLPYVREMRERWSGWLRAWRAVPPGSLVPADLLAILREVPVPTALSRRIGRRPAFQTYPLPGRPLEGPRVVFEDPEFRPREGRPYRIVRPRRTWRGFRGPDGAWEVEELLWAEEEALPQPDGAFFPPPDAGEGPEGSRTGELTERFARESGLPPALGEALLLPLVGSPPWHGRPPGLDLVMGSWAVPTPRISPFAALLRPLLPPWELRSSGRRGARQPRAAPEAAHAVPYLVQLEPVGLRGWDRLAAKGTTFEVSTLLYGELAVDQLDRVLFDAHLPLLEPPTRWLEYLPVDADPELAGRLADRLVRSHFTEPTGMEGDALDRTLKGALGRVREALASVPAQLGLPQGAYEELLVRSRPLRDHLVQAAHAYARLRGDPDVHDEHVRAAADRYVDSLNTLGTGGSSATRELLALGGRIRSKRDRARFFQLRSVLFDEAALALEEVWGKVEGGGLWANVRRLEEDLDRLAAEGVLLVVRPGLYRWAGL